MRRTLVLLAVAASFGSPRDIWAQDAPDNGRVEQDLERLSAAPDYDWLRSKDATGEGPTGSGPASSEAKQNERPPLPEGDNPDCGYGPAPTEKPDKRQPADKGRGGGCGDATPGDGADESGGCERRTGPSCEGCAPSTGCEAGGGLPACGCAGVGTMTGYLLGGLMIAVLLVLSFLAVMRRSGHSPLRVESLDLDEARPQDVRLSQLPEAPLDAMLARAEAAASTGDFRIAVGWCYLAGLAALHRLGRIDLRRSTTNLEIVETVRRRGGGHEAVQALVRTFEDIFFGARPAGEEHYLACREIVEKRLG